PLPPSARFSRLRGRDDRPKAVGISPVIAANVAGYRPDASDRHRPSARGECRLQSDLPAAMRQIDARHIVVVVHGPEGKCEQGGSPPGHAPDVPPGTLALG